MAEQRAGRLGLEAGQILGAVQTNGPPGAWLQGKLLEMLLERLEHVLVVVASSPLTEIHFILLDRMIGLLFLFIVARAAARRWRRTEMDGHRQSTDAFTTTVVLATGDEERRVGRAEMFAGAESVVVVVVGAALPPIPLTCRRVNRRR